MVRHPCLWSTPTFLYRASDGGIHDDRLHSDQYGDNEGLQEKHDRIVEIGIVALSDEGEVEDKKKNIRSILSEMSDQPTSMGSPLVTCLVILRSRGRPQGDPGAGWPHPGRSQCALRHPVPRLRVRESRARDPRPDAVACTMQLSNSYLEGVAGSCRTAAPPPGRARSPAGTAAMGDTRAVAGLLAYYLTCAGVPVPWGEVNKDRTRSHWWPQVEVPGDVGPTFVKAHRAERCFGSSGSPLTCRAVWTHG